MKGNALPMPMTSQMSDESSDGNATVSNVERTADANVIVAEMNDLIVEFFISLDEKSKSTVLTLSYLKHVVTRTS